MIQMVTMMNDIHVGILHDLDAEVYLLSACLINPLVIPKISSLIEPEDFYREAHRNIFQVFLDLHKAGPEITPQILSDSLTNGGQLEVSGGINYIFSIADSNSTSTAWADISEIVKGYSNRRKLVDAGRLLIEHAGNKTIDLDISASQMKEAILDVERSKKVAYHSNMMVCEEIRQDMERMQQEGRHNVGVLTGFKDWDAKMLGIESGLTHYLSADSHTGKSSLALFLSDNLSKASGKRVLYYTLESSQKILMRRRLAYKSGVRLNQIRQGTLGSKQTVKFSQAIAECSEEAVQIFDRPDFCNLDKLMSHAESISTEKDLALIVVDHLQLCWITGKWYNQHVMYKSIAQRLNDFGKKLNVPILILSQVNKSGEMKESGDLYSSADMAFKLSEIGVFNQVKRMKLECIKGKDSGLFVTYLDFDNYTMTWRDGVAPEGESDNI